MPNEIDAIEWARHQIDDAIDEWLRLNGLGDKAIIGIDCSFVNNELDDLLTVGQEIEGGKV